MSGKISSHNPVYLVTPITLMVYAKKNKINMKKQVKDLKPGDNLYFLDTDRHFVTVNKVISAEEEDLGTDDVYIRVTWEPEEYSAYPNYCIIHDDDTSFWEEPDYDSDDYNEDEDEDEERLIFLNKEDIIARITQEINRLQKEIEELNGEENN